ncbi:lipoprotein [Spiroplasma endosymbiont of Anurida maritima]|uniref:lipoprotein n=1 Tax=Spiroplasma endosymbiont of Anurida maritima TaxID=2967972 RepID=UPI0036D33D64
MKKLLSILSSITIIISTAATVIACAPSNNEILEKTESHKNFLLLRDISKIINKKIIQWMKQNAEYIKGDNLELDFLKNIFDKTEKEDFPIEIKPVDFKKNNWEYKFKS